MVKRFSAVFGLILLYMLAVATILLPLLLLLQDHEGLMFVLVLSMLVLSFAGFFPYLDWASKRIFRFRGEGEPVSETTLRAHIRAINQFDVPVMIKEQGRKLVATWKYVDARTPIMNSILRDGWDVGFGIW